MEIITKSASETKKFGEGFASKLKGGETLALVGELGSGKTTFVQGLAKGLGIKTRITSPTFILMRNYDGERSLYHLDLYRLESDVDNDVTNLGLKDFLEKKENVVVIEWAKKIKKTLPKETIWMEFRSIGKDTREIIVK